MRTYTSNHVPKSGIQVHTSYPANLPGCFQSPNKRVVILTSQNYSNISIYYFPHL